MEAAPNRPDPLSSLSRGAQLNRNISVISTASTILPAYEPPPRAHSPTHSTIHEGSERSAAPYRPEPLLDQATVPLRSDDLERQTPPPADLLRAPTYRTINSILPPYTRKGSKYQELLGDNGSLRPRPNGCGCMMDYGWRIWGAVVAVVLLTMITVIVVVILTEKKSSN